MLVHHGERVASRVVNAIPFIYDNADVRYLAQSAVFLEWAATVPVLLLWHARRARAGR
jgi:hypothetical protein